MHSFLSKLAARPTSAVLAIGLALLLSGNWILPLVDRDEPRFAEASRGMGQRHDWVIPWLNGAYRFDKPPLIYWCQTACYRLMGESPWSARLPSALFGVGTALLVLTWGRRAGKPTVGFHAALIWLTSLQVLIHGRMALADMAMVFFVTAANWTGWELTRPEVANRWKWILAFTFSLGLGFLAKGPVSWLPVAGLAVCRWRWPAEFRLPWAVLPISLVGALAIVGLWGIPALTLTHGEFLKVGLGRHVLQRSFDVMEGHGGNGWIGYVLTTPLYFVTFFMSFLPWAFAVPLSAWRWWKSREADAEGAYLLIQALLVFVVFSFVRTKLPHYTLPALPCVALWLAGRAAFREAGSRWLTRGVLAMVVLNFALTLGVFSLGQSRLIGPNLWREVSPHVRPDMEMGVVGFNEPSLIWEFRAGVTNYVEYLRPEQAVGFLARPGSRILVVPTPQAEGALKDAAPKGRRFRAQGLDTVHFERHDLTAILVEPR